MAVKTFTSTTLSASDTNTYLANSGLVYVTSYAVGSTNVGSVIIPNAFNSTYDNYRVIWSGGSMSAASATMQFQLRTGSSTSTTGYYYGMTGTTFAGASTMAGGSNDSRVIYGGGGDSGVWGHFDAEFFSPYQAIYTKFWCDYLYGAGAARTTGVHAVATSYDQLVLTPFSGTMVNGTITVYGYRKQ